MKYCNVLNFKEKSKLGLSALDVPNKIKIKKSRALTTLSVSNSHQKKFSELLLTQLSTVEPLL